MQKQAGTCLCVSHERLCMCEDGIVRESVHVLVCGSGRPAVEGEALKEGLLMKRRSQ